MVDFIRKRLQVFVSSTYSDLIHERQAAVEAILTAGHIPAGMELFSAGDESQMEVIKQWIDESDVYLLILGGRYGSIEPKSGKSYTQLEYEYALDQGKPAFACVINETTVDKRALNLGCLDLVERENPQKLKEFRDFVLGKIVRFWDDVKDIKLTIGETLAHLSRREDLVGWVRATEQVNVPALADEIARLSKENATLRNQLERSKSDVIIKGLTFEQVKEILKSKNLLDFIVDKRINLVQGLKMFEYPAEVQQLVAMGLAEVNHTLKKHVFTEAGFVFMNMIELEQITKSKCVQD
ncbi:DUF4062 domain-containing protein [Geomesophilobacter sediminis]|uniref:DUF4062 domain-containing protein n=1 Tax=Geomesophilobacter sediminis TaxID=2798584 RepID=A0A8J7M1Q4_9BACT|nr:DUF4062 domain-containing protein [Geomesophilobacter sediminis]MBJ6726813.1 DUF4062 domain-containing protein [Geomesophilobacter sediminis]